MATGTTAPSLERKTPARNFTVAWLGTRPAWLDLPTTQAELDGVELTFPADARNARSVASHIGVRPDVLHLADSRVRDAARLRRLLPESALVLDLRQNTAPGWGRGRALARQRAAADVIVVGSGLELREARRRHPHLAERIVFIERPVDLERHAPPQALLSRGDGFGEFRRTRRLHGPVLLFAGPYARRGGLDMAIAAAASLRSRIPGLRFAAIRQGELDEGYLRRCRKQAATLELATVLQDVPPAHEVALWYAAAKVVCIPARDGAGAEPARLAAAAGRALVASEVEPLLERVADGQTGLLVPVDDVDALVEAIEGLLADEAERERLGELARRRMESQASPAAAAARLRQEWEEAVSRHRASRG